MKIKFYGTNTAISILSTCFYFDLVEEQNMVLSKKIPIFLISLFMGSLISCQSKNDSTPVEEQGHSRFNKNSNEISEGVYAAKGEGFVHLIAIKRTKTELKGYFIVDGTSDQSGTASQIYSMRKGTSSGFFGHRSAESIYDSKNTKYIYKVLGFTDETSPNCKNPKPIMHERSFSVYSTNGENLFIDENSEEYSAECFISTGGNQGYATPLSPEVVYSKTHEFKKLTTEELKNLFENKRFIYRTRSSLGAGHLSQEENETCKEYFGMPCNDLEPGLPGVDPNKVRYVGPKIVTFWPTDVNSNPTPDTPYTISNIENGNKLNALINKTKVSCKDSNNCNESIGLLAMSSNHGHLGQCTAFLVSKNIVATNAHCIPEDLRVNRRLCDGRLWMFFPKTMNFLSQKVECKEILQTAQIDKESVAADYAFIELQEDVQRPIISTTQEPVSAFLPIEIVSVDPIKDSGILEGIINKSNCNIQFNTEGVLDLLGTVNTSIVKISSCDRELMPGNSGSPLLNSGKALGVFSHSINTSVGYYMTNDPNIKATHQFNGYLGANFYCLETIMNPIKQGVNCVDSFVFRDEQEKAKENVRKAVLQLGKNADDKRLREEALQSVKNLLENNKSYMKSEADSSIKQKKSKTWDSIYSADPMIRFGWHTEIQSDSVPENFKALLIPSPACIGSMDEFKEKYAKEKPLYAFFSEDEYLTDAVISYDLETFEFGVERANASTLSLKQKVAAPAKIELRFNPSEFIKGSTGKMRLLSGSLDLTFTVRSNCQ